MTPVPTAAAALLAASLACAPLPAAADAARSAHCTATADLLRRACGAELLDDRFVAQARCENVADAGAREECLAELRDEQAEGKQLCQARHEWRLAACAMLGEARYDPDFDPARFDTDFHQLANPNPYFPLTIGYRWSYAGGDEVNTVEIADETKSIEGVTCVVLRDLVYDEDGELVEATDDWLAAGLDGSSWYCGEESKNYESFEGDMPPRAELVSIEGSFKHGRDGAKAGLIMPAVFAPGQVWREEFSLGDAEDMAELVSAQYQHGVDPALDHGVPKALADRLCSHDCVVTRNVSLLEPGVVEYKYYARGIGFFLETSPDEGTVLQLVGCSFDPRCAGLPAP